MKRLPIATGMALATVVLFTSLASARVTFNIEIQPQLVPVPGLPVYYAPELPQNYFSFGGQYYLFSDGVWYVAPTFRGPWVFLPLANVPPPLLSVPVEFYRAPIHGWRRGGPPPWARHREEFREHEERERRAFEREREEHRRFEHERGEHREERR
jgi:hypothetical protein